MKKVLSFSVFLLVGLAVSQVLPFVAGDATRSVKVVTDIFLYICLAFIMINVGREFEIDKSRISIRLTAPYSDDRRKAASELAKKRGIHTKP